MKRKVVLLIIVVLALFSVAIFAQGQGEIDAINNYPSKPIQVICGYGSGGDADVYGRLFSKYLEKYIGKPVVVSNVTGAGGSVGARQVIDGTSDGYTVLFSHWGSLMNTLMGIGNYDITEDFKIACICVLDTNTIIATDADGRFTDMQSLIEYAKQNPEDVRASIEVGSVVHLTTSVIQDKFGIKFHLIDTGNKANELASLMSNQVDMTLNQYAVVKDYLDSGDFVGLAYLNDERNVNYPDIPTIEEYGIKMPEFYDKFFWFGFPKDTPSEIVDKFNEAVKKVVADPEAKAEFAKFGADLTFVNGVESVDYINKVRAAFEPYMVTIM